MKKLAALALVPLLALSLSACSKGPSKADVKKGFVKAYEKELSDNGLAKGKAIDKMLDALFSCVVDESYKDLSQEGREILAKGDNNEKMKLSDKDNAALEKAVDVCVGDIGF